MLAAWRQHRARSSYASPFVLPSVLFAVTPWVWPSPLGLIVSMCAHVAWLIVCEFAAPSPVHTTTQAPPRARAAAPAHPASTGPRPLTRDATRDTSGFIATTVLAVLDEATDIKTFRLARPHGFDFVAGQFVPVRVLVDSQPHVRCYSISSSPDTNAYLEISVRRQGLVSTTLHATLRTGSQLAVGRAAGRFVYPAGDDRPLALLAAGIGITPLLSMLRHAVSSDPTRPVTLLYSARDRQAMAFLPELRVLAQRHPQIKIALTVSEPSAPAPWRTGRIDQALLRQYVPHPEHTIFCTCGPDAMMAAMEALLIAEGVPKTQIRSEQFDTTAAAQVLNPVHARSTASVPETHGEFTITFAATGRSTIASGSQSLLDAAEADGVAITTSCRSGVCQACRTRLTSGDVDCRSDVLDADDRAAGYILPCVSWAHSDCVLEA